jgi:hypothetical protein
MRVALMNPACINCASKNIIKKMRYTKNIERYMTQFDNVPIKNLFPKVTSLRCVRFVGETGHQ